MPIVPGSPIIAADFAGYARVTRSGPQTIAHNTTTKVNFNVVEYDPHGLWNQTQTAFVIPAGFDGVYHVLLSVAFNLPVSPTGNRDMAIRRNGEAVLSVNNAAMSNARTKLNAGTDLILNAGDVVEAVVYHSQGSSITILNDGADRTHFALHRVRPL